MVLCEWVIYHQDFAGPDGLGGDMHEEACHEPAVRRIVTDDEAGEAYMTMVIGNLGGWDGYRAACKSGMEGKPYDPGDDPGEGHYGEVTWLLCTQHAAELRHDAATGEALGMTILSDERLTPAGH